MTTIFKYFIHIQNVREVNIYEKTDNTLPILQQSCNPERCFLCVWPSLIRGKVYVCSHYPACDSYVGVHQGTSLPKGSLANRTLRKKRIQAHQIFDQLWRKGIFSREEAYRWIGDKFCLQTRQAHIGNFSDYMCDQLIQEASKVLQNNHIPLGMAG